MSDAKFASDIRRAAWGERIEGIVIGNMGWRDDYNAEGKPPYKHLIGKLITWEEAKPILDYYYDTGYGAPDCQAIYAWTPTKVILVIQHDGATSVVSVPRNPKAVIPEMFGG